VEYTRSEKWERCIICSQKLALERRRAKRCPESLRPWQVCYRDERFTEIDRLLGGEAGRGWVGPLGEVVPA
jgi:hypothetical protein